MTLYPPRPPSFTCAICNEHRDWSAGHPVRRWENATEYDIPPICRSCEITWGRAIGGWGDRNRDRRIAGQIGALARAIETTAYRMQHERAPHHGRA